MIDLDAFGMVPKDILMAITSNEKAKRKQLGVTLQELARKSGASLPSLRRFEQKGEISLSSLVDIAPYILESRNAFGVTDRETHENW